MTERTPQASPRALEHLHQVSLQFPLQIYVNLVSEDDGDGVAVIIGQVGDPDERACMIRAILDTTGAGENLIATATLVADHITLLGRRAEEILRFARTQPEPGFATYAEAVIAFNETEGARRAESR